MDRKEYQRQWQENYRKDPDNSNLAKIRQITREALESGEIQKQNCIVCGSEKSEMHHPDYSQTFLIEWLCRKHHMEKHPRKTVVKKETVKMTCPDNAALVNNTKIPHSVKEYLREIGRKGGSAKSEIKADSSRRNGKLGGRPKNKTK